MGHRCARHARGGTRRLVIPPDYAYGSQEREKIPANSTLLFEIQLAGVY